MGFTRRIALARQQNTKKVGLRAMSPLSVDSNSHRRLHARGGEPVAREKQKKRGFAGGFSTGWWVKFYRWRHSTIGNQNPRAFSLNPPKVLKNIICELLDRGNIYGLLHKMWNQKSRRRQELHPMRRSIVHCRRYRATTIRR